MYQFLSCCKNSKTSSRKCWFTVYLKDDERANVCHIWMIVGYMKEIHRQTTEPILQHFWSYTIDMMLALEKI
ncbi:hypothetical protein L1987_49705 [Smallanthus sonchifolius]|uniref:Uncharacterized protein n=1 Tax=Smallanthus sonchifolius TaxID=185202 RepID=A0ACB9FWI3_9ASTR|nr:hypothetical protein L1987_49705 [Smallanthus sonchifolius]